MTNHEELIEKMVNSRASSPSSSMEFHLLKDINIANSEKEVEEEIKGDKEDRINEMVHWAPRF